MATQQMKISLLPKEHWWGGIVDDGVLMPYHSDSDHTGSLLPCNTSNQTAPFLVSDQGRYLWCDQPFTYRFQEGMLTVSNDLDTPFVLKQVGTSLQEAYLAAANAHFPANNRMPAPAFFAHPQYNTWIELMYDQNEAAILQYAQDILDEGYPTGILMIDDNWQEDYGMWDFHPGRFQDAKGMIQKLHTMGFDVMLWVCPFISPDSLLCRNLHKQGLLVKNADGTLAIREWWNGYSAVLDLTNPAACQWFSDRLQHLTDHYGVDGFKFDAGDPRFYRDDDLIHTPGHAQTQCKAYALFGEQFSFNEYRSSYDVAGKGLAQRLCDKNHSWEENGLASLIPNALAQGLLGYTFNCPDMIGGGEYQNFLPEVLNIDEELVVRYAQCAALFPMMQFSVAPWRILSKEHAAICLDMALLHEQFGEDIVALATASAKTGEPILKHLAYHYGADFADITDQFLLGDTIMVAPIVTKGATSRTVVFPQGSWLGDDGVCVEGPCTTVIDVPITRLPYFQKQ